MRFKHLSGANVVQKMKKMSNGSFMTVAHDKGSAPIIDGVVAECELLSAVAIACNKSNIIPCSAVKADISAVLFPSPLLVCAVIRNVYFCFTRNPSTLYVVSFAGTGKFNSRLSPSLL